jgi:hypothetical protein
LLPLKIEIHMHVAKSPMFSKIKSIPSRPRSYCDLGKVLICIGPQPWYVSEKRKRDATFLNILKDEKGMRDLKIALKDDAFYMGFTGKVSGDSRRSTHVTM